MRVEALLQSQDLQQLSLAHASLFQAQASASGDDDACLPVSSVSRARYCAAALLPSPLTSLSSCPLAQVVSGPRSEVSCARASCNMFGSSDGDGVGDDFAHQWCAGRATLRFGRNVYDAGASLFCFVTCAATLMIIPSTVAAEGNLFDLNEFKIHGQLSHLNSACLNLSSYDLTQKVTHAPAIAPAQSLYRAEALGRLWLHLWDTVGAGSRCVPQAISKRTI
jgi:hypothetical protein